MHKCSAIKVIHPKYYKQWIYIFSGIAMFSLFWHQKKFILKTKNFIICFAHENIKNHPLNIKMLYEISEFLNTSLMPQSAQKQKGARFIWVFIVVGNI